MVRPRHGEIGARGVRQSTGMAKLGVVMVAHRSAVVIGDCLRSVAADLATISETVHEAQATVVVVDNASTDDSVAVARAALPDVVVHQTGANLGYAAGLNAGFACLPDADKVLVLNPDVRLLPGALAAMLAAFSDPGIGIVVPRIVDEGGAVQWSMRRRPTVLRAFGEAVLGGRRAGRVRPLGEMVVDEDAYAAPACPDWATGAAMLLSRRCIDTIGLWDESFFMYSEETEYALRAANAGFILKYTPTRPLCILVAKR